MLSFPASTRIFLAVEPVDMRKSFDGLLVPLTSMFAFKDLSFKHPLEF